MKNYLRNVSQEKQWDIIQQVINQYGHRTEKIVEMVDDGYQVTNELLELLYRLHSVETIKSLMYRIDDSLSSKDFLCTTKMEIFKNALGEKEALELREKIVEERRQEKALIEEQKMQERQTKVEEFHKEYGLKEKFFEAIIQSKEFMKIALEKPLTERKKITEEPYLCHYSICSKRKNPRTPFRSAWRWRKRSPSTDCAT